jgi:hypothetical protein
MPVSGLLADDPVLGQPTLHQFRPDRMTRLWRPPREGMAALGKEVHLRRDACRIARPGIEGAVADRVAASGVALDAPV